MGILINVNNVAIGAEEHQSLVTIGLDTSGGSSFTDFINHLVCGPANAYGEPGSGVWYYCRRPIASADSRVVYREPRDSTARRVSSSICVKPERPAANIVSHG